MLDDKIFHFAISAGFKQKCSLNIDMKYSLFINKVGIFN